MPPPFAVVCWNVDFTSPPQFTPDGTAAEHIATSIETLLGESETPVLLFLLECNVRHFNRGSYQCLDTALGKRGFSVLTKVDVSTKECILIAVRGMTLVASGPSAAWRAHYLSFEASANALLTPFGRTTRSGTTSTPTVLPNTELRDIAIAVIQLADGTQLRVASMHAAAPGRGSRKTDAGGSGVKITEQHVSSVLASLLGHTDILIGDFNLAPNRTHMTTVNRTTIQATGFHSFNAFYTTEETTSGGHRYDHAYMAPGYVGTLRVLSGVCEAISSVHDPIMLREIHWGPVHVPLPRLSTFVPYLGFGSAPSSSSNALVPVRPPPPSFPSGFDFTSLFQLPETATPLFNFNSAPLPPFGGLFNHGSSTTSGPPRLPSQTVMFANAYQRARREQSLRDRRGLPSTGERDLVREAMLSLRRQASSTAQRLRLGDFARLMTRGQGRPLIGKFRRMNLLIRSTTESGYRVLQAQRLLNVEDRSPVPFTGNLQNTFRFTLTPVLRPEFSRMLGLPSPEPVERLPMDAEVVGVSWEDVDDNGGALLLTPGPVYFA